MLSRTADHIFWMARYLERVDNTVRLLSVCSSTAPMSNDENVIQNSWRSVLETLETYEEYQQTEQELNAKSVVHYVVANTDYASSVISCLTSARENVRAIRGTLSSDVWEAINGTWIDLQRQLKNQALTKDPSRLFDWISGRISFINGVIQGTMLRNEAYHFMRLGTFLERADNTARMLNVRFFLDEQSSSAESKNINKVYHWSAVLRSLSSLEIYRHVMRDTIDSNRVIELIVLQRNMPHSLAYATKGIYDKLRALGNHHSSETERIAGKLEAKLRFMSIQEIQEQGVQEFLTEFLEEIQYIGLGISNDFLWPSEAI